MQFYNISGGQYDIIGFDPRGVGEYTVYVTLRIIKCERASLTRNRSYSPTAISCWETQKEYFDYFNGTPVGFPFDHSGNFTEQDEIAWYNLMEPTEKALEDLKAICDNSTSAGLFSYVGTAAVARDIVAMTEFLDGEGADVNFWGFS